MSRDLAEPIVGTGFENRAWSLFNESFVSVPKRGPCVGVRLWMVAAENRLISLEIYVWKCNLDSRTTYSKARRRHGRWEITFYCWMWVVLLSWNRRQIDDPPRMSGIWVSFFFLRVCVFFFFSEEPISIFGKLFSGKNRGSVIVVFLSPSCERHVDIDRNPASCPF